MFVKTNQPMKKLTLLSFLLLLTVAGYSQNSFYNNSYEARNSGSFSQETSIVSFGFGFPNVPVNNYDVFGYNSNSSGVGPLYVKYEHGFLRDEVGLGGVIGNSFGSRKYSTDGKTKIFAISFAVNGYYHFNKLIPVEKLDVYAGAGLGLVSISTKDDDLNVDDTNVDFNLNGLVGARYYFTNSFGAYAEISYDGMSYSNIGVSLRF